VRAAIRGTLTLHPNSGGCGNEARIQHSSGYSVRYCHFSTYLRGGGHVEVGDEIALSGATGYTEPPGADHVHFELKNPSGVRVHPGCPPGVGGNCNDWTSTSYWAVSAGRVVKASEAQGRGALDWDGDGCADLLARRSDDASLRLYGGDCAGGYRSEGQLIGTSWGDFDRLFTVRDWDGDGCADVIGRRASDASLRLYAGNCAGSFKSENVAIGTSWGDFDQLFGADDFDGDGCADVIGRRASDSTLRLYAGNCAGGWKSLNVTIGTSWGDFEPLFSASDWDGDGCSDVIGRRSSDSSLRLYAGNCAGGWKSVNVAMGTSWGDFDRLLARDWNGDGCADVIGRRSSDQSLRLYAGNCAGGYSSENVPIGQGWGAIDTIF
jgi:uncharacterized membrane protein